MAIRLTFWGVRGSIPTPGPNTVKYGGNTSCLELRFGADDRLVIVDAGSGIRELGGKLLANDLKKGPIRTKLFLSHTHWDHIMGFPFFTPIFIPSTELDVYGPVSFEDDPLEKVVGYQLSYRYFPVRQEELKSAIKFVPLKEGTQDLGDGLRVRTKYLNHPILVLGYRFEFEGRALCTVYDHEPYQNVFDIPPDAPGYDVEAVNEGAAAAAAENQKVQQFIHGADLLVHDTQYTSKEWKNGKKGWGHSTFWWALKSAHDAGVKHLVLFHHDPDRSDAKLEKICQGCRAYLAAKSRRRIPMQVSIAQEGRTFEI